ncbi:hypothetical protein LTSEHVI_4288 [Salmonella enterica subsp. enterica serovar Hvittingfoss str. A4-620]|nr:hypothetical protein LTSEHVI_4288 [Salmonella enterica subsp. enterica serovar Hvittingfoss str. A4-620]
MIIDAGWRMPCMPSGVTIDLWRMPSGVTIDLNLPIRRL